MGMNAYGNLEDERDPVSSITYAKLRMKMLTAINVGSDCRTSEIGNYLMKSDSISGNLSRKKIVESNYFVKLILL